MTYKTKNSAKVAVFDLDGTLIDSDRKLRSDVKSVFSRLGVKISDYEANSNWYKLAEKYGISREQFDKEFDKRKSWEQALKEREVNLYSDTIPCLDSLKKSGTRLVLLSKSKKEYTDLKVDYFNLRKYFEKISTVPVESHSKTKGALELIASLNPETISKAYFIGDREEDVSVADDIRKERGIETEGIYINRHNQPTLENYLSVNSLDKIPEIILGGKNGR